MSNTNTMNILKSVEDLYLKGDYQSAINELLKAKSQLDAGLFHFNLGTLHLKQNSLGPARYNLEKAKSIGFNYSIVKKNINVIKADQSIVDISNGGTYFNQAMINTIETPMYMFGLSALLISIVLILLARYKKISLQSFAILFLLIVAAPFSIKFYTYSQLDDVVVMQDSSILEGPSKIYSENGTIKAGSKVIIGKKLNNWYLIEYPDQVSGWIHREKIGFYREKI